MDALLALDSLISYFEPANAFETHLYYDEYMLQHIGTNCETADRVAKSFDALNGYHLLSHPNLTVIQPQQANEAELLLSHSAKHVENMSHLNTNDFKSVEIAYNEHTSKAAKLAAGACIQLFDSIASSSNICRNGFALIRPPGHHCEYDKPMGFCIFNNVVVGVNYLRQKYNDNLKILIVDFDVHAGNGTSSAFIDCDNVLYFSIHRYNHGQFYPYSGRIEEDGNNGMNVNVPIDIYRSPGYGDAEYLLIFEQVLMPMANEFRPDMVVVSAGFDSCIGDLLGGMTLTPYCFGVMVKQLMDICSKCAVVLEGGYECRMVARCCCCVLYALLNSDCEMLNECGSFEKEFNRFIGRYGTHKIEEFGKWKEWYGHLLRATRVAQSTENAKLSAKVNALDKKHGAIARLLQSKKNERRQRCDNLKECKLLIQKIIKRQSKYWACFQNT